MIGAYAAVLAGVDVITRDIDITPATDHTNLERLADALTELHAAMRVANQPSVALPPPRSARTRARH